LEIVFCKRQTSFLVVKTVKCKRGINFLEVFLSIPKGNTAYMIGSCGNQIDSTLHMLLRSRGIFGFYLKIGHFSSMFGENQDFLGVKSVSLKKVVILRHVRFPKVR